MKKSLYQESFSVKFPSGAVREWYPRHDTTGASTPEGKDNSCNCRDRTCCPLDGKCQLSNVVYLAEISTVENPQHKRFYIGISKNKWKSRYYIHTRSFRNRSSDNHTTLSRHHWELIDKGLTPIVSWKILCVVNTPRNLRDSRLLCLS